MTNLAFNFETMGLTSDQVCHCSAGKKHAADEIGHHPCQLAFVIQLSKLLREVQEGYLGDHQDLANNLKVASSIPVVSSCITIRNC